MSDAGFDVSGCWRCSVVSPEIYDMDDFLRTGSYVQNVDLFAIDMLR